MTRGRIIREMLDIFEYECPWVLHFYPQFYMLEHDWFHNLKLNTLIYSAKKYMDVDAELRYRKRQEWNRPVLWPAYGFAIGMAVLLTPAIRTYLRRTRR